MFKNFYKVRIHTAVSRVPASQDSLAMASLAAISTSVLWKQMIAMSMLTVQIFSVDMSATVLLDGMAMEHSVRIWTSVQVNLTFKAVF